jgi:hypothetical protein
LNSQFVRGNKFAYTFEGVAALQKDPETHTIAMQFLLDCVHRVVKDVYGVTLPADVSTLVGTINAGAESVIRLTKPISVLIQQPIRARLCVAQALDTATGEMRWRITCGDETTTLDLTSEDIHAIDSHSIRPVAVPRTRGLTLVDVG